MILLARYGKGLHQHKEPSEECQGDHARAVQEVNMSGLCEQLYRGRSKGERETVISGMKVPFTETGGIGQARLWGKDRVWIWTLEI